MDGAEVRSGTRFYCTGCIFVCDNQVKSRGNIDDYSLRDIYSQVVGEHCGHKLRDLRLLAHLTPAEFGDDLKRLPCAVLAAEEQWAIPPRRHRSDELRGAELEHVHVPASLLKERMEISEPL